MQYCKTKAVCFGEKSSILELKEVPSKTKT